LIAFLNKLVELTVSILRPFNSDFFKILIFNALFYNKDLLTYTNELLKITRGFVRGQPTTIYLYNYQEIPTVRSKELSRLAKFLFYVLGHHPDEFGLVPDSKGFVKLKELLKAVNEEAQWRYVRKSHIVELCISHTKPPIEIVNNLIRAADQNQLPTPILTIDKPKLLYTCVRTKAYPVILEKGILPMGKPWIILAPEHDMALRMGRRLDPSPVLLTINVKQAISAQVKILTFGRSLYLAPKIPKGCFIGPSIPKEKSNKKETTQPITPPKRGSFFLDVSREDNPLNSKKIIKGKKDKGWKEARRKDKRRRKNDWP
jgi:putative RNA 2'-phosphotransferase